MAKEASFDIVSDFDTMELINATDQAKREITNRYDFKGTDSEININDDKTEISLTSDSDYKVDAMVDVLKSKFINRNLSLKILDLSKEKETIGGGRVKQTIPLIKGLNNEKAKKITKLIRESYPKVKAQVQGESVRVFSPKRDELQEVMSLLKKEELDFPIQFENYR